MFKKALVLVGLVSIIFAGGCSGGGGDGTPEPTVPEQLTTAKTYLESGDIASARATYSAIIGDAAATTVAKVIKSTPEPENAEARVGRALCDIMLLIEKAPFTAILAGFGQPAWATSSVFGPTGYLYLSTTETNPDESALPFYNARDCWKGATGHYHSYRCFITHMTSSYIIPNIAASLNELMTSVDSIIADLSVAIGTAGAAYNIPKALYTGDADIPLNHADMVQMLAGMYMLKAASDFANSWNFNIDLSSLVDSNGNSLLSKAQVVTLLNQQFGLRADNRLSSARTNLQTALTYSLASLQEVLAGASGGVLNLSTDNQSIYNDLNSLVSSINNSMSGGVALEQVLPIVEVNLNDFFNNPANGDAIASDPFVYSGGRIVAVEAWWQQMIATACNYTLRTHIKMFSDATRAIARPYYKLFNAIMGHKFGNFQAGGGA